MSVEIHKITNIIWDINPNRKGNSMIDSSNGMERKQQMHEHKR